MMWDFPYMGWGWAMVVFMVLFWGAIIALIIWAIKRFTERGGAVSKRSALDIAKERYARGEISKEQFDQLKKDLS